MTDKRVMIFIDGSNFYHSLKNSNLPTTVDFIRLSNQIVGPDRELVRIYYYNAEVNEDDGRDHFEKQKRFLDDLRELTYFELRLAHLEHRPGGMVDKGTDVMLAVDMVMFAVRDLYDVAVLISGDSDFVSAVQHVKDMGKHVEVAYPVEGKAFSLKQACDKFIPIGISQITVPQKPKQVITAPPEKPKTPLKQAAKSSKKQTSAKPAKPDRRKSTWSKKPKSYSANSRTKKKTT